jgi:c(7)-type cytochrome triheme protein
MRALVLSGLLLLLAVTNVRAEFFNLPPTAAPEEYGNILIDRTSSRSGVKPVAFSHWQHRMKYTCRVCHSELEFNMKVNSTEITEMANRKGRYCGACHNGKVSFKHNGNCGKCHTGNIGATNAKFEVFFKNAFPRTSYGDGINWSEALRTGVVTPGNYLKSKSEDIPFDKLLLLEAEMNIIPPAVFPHKEHSAWLDCNSCHPDLFNIKKKSTQHFSMSYILRGDFCGTCHLNVAFPMNDCKRCHPGIKEES